jgi:Mg-chelatase subunit ChlI
VVACPVACNTRDVAGSVLLERDRELAELAQAAGEAAAGEGGLVLVSGEAGIGKSSLVRAVRGLLPAGAEGVAVVLAGMGLLVHRKHARG